MRIVGSISLSFVPILMGSFVNMTPLESVTAAAHVDLSEGSLLLSISCTAIV